MSFFSFNIFLNIYATIDRTITSSVLAMVEFLKENMCLHGFYQLFSRCSKGSMKERLSLHRPINTTCSVMTMIQVRNAACQPGLTGFCGDANPSLNIKVRHGQLITDFCPNFDPKCEKLFQSSMVTWIISEREMQCRNDQNFVREIVHSDIVPYLISK